MNRKQETAFLKKAGTKKQYKAAMQQSRCRSFLNQNLGTVTNKTEADYDRRREKASLRKEIREVSDG